MNEPHPWGVFLEARAKCIMYFRQNGKTDRQIAHALSMDEHQVFLIARYQESLERKGNEE